MENGILVPEKDEIALANAILKLINEPKLYSKIVKNSNTAIKKDFSIDSRVGELKRIFLEHQIRFN